MAQSRNSWGSNNPARRKGYRTLRYWADEHDGRGYVRHCKTIKGTKRDGDAELAKLRMAHSEDRPAPTVQECYETWFVPDAESRLSKQTLKVYRSAWNAHIRPRWADCAVTGIKPLDVQEWLLTKTKSQAEISSKVLAGILDYPVMYEMLDRNPMRIKYRMPTAGEQRDKSVYDLKESLAILRAAKGSYAEPAIVLGLFGSCRVGESIAPLVEDVEPMTAGNGMPGCSVLISKQVDKNGEVEDMLKTKWSERHIVLAGEPALRVLQIADERRAESLPWLCDDGTGQPVPPRYITAEWRRVAESAGVEYHILRNLRNSWRTYMEWELGVDAAKLETLMGHKGDTVTAKHYNRPSVQMLLDAVAEAYARAGLFDCVRAK